MRIVHSQTGQVLGQNIISATSFWRRLRGYMFYRSPSQKFDGILFPNSKCIHNCFVRFPIDAIFVDRSGTIVKIIRKFRPWQFSLIYFKASHVLELPEGKVQNAISLGDKLVIESGDKYF